MASYKTPVTIGPTEDPTPRKNMVTPRVVVNESIPKAIALIGGVVTAYPALKMPYNAPTMINE